jgi:CHAT domain-containing protein
MRYAILFFGGFLLQTNAYAQPTDSLGAARQVDSLIGISRSLTGQKAFDQALETNALAESLALETFGRSSAPYSSCAFNRGRIYHFGEQASEAEKWYLEAKAIQEIVLGREHPAYAQTLNNLAALYRSKGQRETALQLFLEAKDIREGLLGKEHPDYIGSLVSLANIYQLMDLHEQALPLYQESLPLFERTLSRAHPDYAGNLYNLARVYHALGRHDDAERDYLDAATTWEAITGKIHPQYSDIVYDLAGFYRELGKYELSESLYLECRTIREKIYGPDHSRYVWVLQRMASLYRDMGLFDKAETLHLQVRADFERIYGKENIDYASILNNLGNLYFNLGYYEKTEHLYLEANAITLKALGAAHPEYARGVSNLGNLYRTTGRFDPAEQLLLESHAILEKALGSDHPDHGASLEKLGLLYSDMGRYAQAETYYLASHQNLKKALGPEHPHYARNLNNLATLYVHMGQYDQAERLHQAARAIREKTLGHMHPDYTASLQNLSAICEITTRYEESTTLMAKALPLIRAQIVNAASYLSEQELARFARTHQGSTEVNAYLLARPAEAVASLSGISYDQALFHKGFLMEAAARLQALAGSTPEAAAINSELKSYRRRIAQQLAKPIAERQHLDELEARADKLEKDLARSVNGYAEALRQVRWQDVQSMLPPHTAALEFVHFRIDFPRQTDSVYYAALLLCPGLTEPVFIPLFEARELDHLLDVDRERKADYVNDLYAHADRSLVKLGQKQRSLYEIIWEKIDAAGLEGVTSVYYSPSGVLHRINLGAIAIDDEQMLADRFHLVALNSTRQLVFTGPAHMQARDAVLVGGVDFDGPASGTAPEPANMLALRSGTDAWTESASRGGVWASLKWTEREVDRISGTLTNAGFTATSFTAGDATEEQIKNLGAKGPSPRILHIATHGFFFPDPDQISASGRGWGSEEPVFKWSDHPMIRSGLILTGGNYAWQHGRAAAPDQEDGILTAYEISQMDLSHTELVVLSACETGLGDIQGNEGVYGLQRAFKIAGAKYLIMSLWQVPDRETMEFMTTFYKHWLEQNMNIPEAFRTTQRAMKDRFINPYAWGAFVLME